jgi:hypothetical protein
VWFDVDCKSTSTGVEAYWNALMQYAITKEPTYITILLYIYVVLVIVCLWWLCHVHPAQQWRSNTMDFMSTPCRLE